jgi:putative intracellular protease/amidase
MQKRSIVWGIAAATALGVTGFAIWIAMLPGVAPAKPAAIAPAETQAMLAALKPPKRQRPLVAIIGINDGTETTDYLVPYGILRRAGIADVMLLATKPGRVTLYPVLRVEAQATAADFDGRNPSGADYVIVPAMKRDDDPIALAWIKSQKAKGAIIISVCAGAKVLANTGLLDGRRATTHWYYLKAWRRKHPAIRYVPDRRMVADRGVATTTGITASIPTMLTLIEAIAGAEKAKSVANELGIDHWDARHDSGAFRFTRPFALTAMENLLAFWRHEKVGLQLQPGMDEVALALVADAWSRTYRSNVVAFAAAAMPVETRSGIRLVPDQSVKDWTGDKLVAFDAAQKPQQALDVALGGIESRYGRSTADFVAMQLEYPAQRY